MKYSLSPTQKMQVTTIANILKDAKIVKKNEKAIEVQEKDNHNYSTIIYNESEHQTFI